MILGISSLLSNFAINKDVNKLSMVLSFNELTLHPTNISNNELSQFIKTQFESIIVRYTFLEWSWV
jgi:hypothetical protein